MNVETTNGMSIDSTVINNYFKSLVNHFFKILPMRENNEPSLCLYMKTLQSELIGCKDLVLAIQNDASYMTLLAILQYLIDSIDDPECTVMVVRRNVFRAISICNKLKLQYADGEVF